MMLKFTKMHGLGNDFIVIDGVRQRVILSEQTIAKLSDRHLGIGFDQCLIVEESKEKGIDFRYKIYNANGKEVGQCGNGARCLARFIKQQGLSCKNKYVVATNTTIMEMTIENDETVTVSFDKPIFEPSQIPLAYSSQQKSYLIPLDFDEDCAVHALSLGNPHAVLSVESFNRLLQNPALDSSGTKNRRVALDCTLAKEDSNLESIKQIESTVEFFKKYNDDYVAKYGAAISNNGLFPEQVNVGFMRILSKSVIQLRVYERGCGETQACGSGAVAAAAVGILYYGLDKTVTVKLSGGDLKVMWPTVGEKIFLNGPAHFVFHGEIDIPKKRS